MRTEQGGGPPDTTAIRAARHNIRYHLGYVGWLARQRTWLAGERLSYADLAAAAHLSVADYLGDVPWTEDEAAKTWYARVKSRPSFRPLLSESGAGHPAVGDLRGPRLLNADIKAALRATAREHGFDVVGVTRPDAIPHAKPLFRALHRRGPAWRHGLARRARRRGAPIRRCCGRMRASVIMLGMNYGPDRDPLAILAQRDRGAISVYAQGDDYHDLIKSRLKAVARWLIANAGGDVKVFVDTAAVMEKPLAARAGLGWQGKHTNLVSREHGSWLFLGAIFTTLALEPDAAEIDHCGIVLAPASTSVRPRRFPAPYRLDARRCISYLTIEHKGPIPRALRPLMGNRIYGCDDCLAVCPWNKFAHAGREAKLSAREALRAPELAELARLDDAAFRALFAKSPVKRTGRDRFVRNVLIAIGNSGDAALAAEAERLLDDASPLVRGAAVWALGRARSGRA